MNVETLRNVLLWCAIINYAFLILSVLLTIAAHDQIYRIQFKLFHLPIEQSDTLNYGGMTLTKTGIILLKITPYAAIWIAGKG